MWLQGSSEKGVIMFKTTCLQCRVRLEPEFMQTLHLSAQPNPDSMEQWQPEEMQVGRGPRRRRRLCRGSTRLGVGAGCVMTSWSDGMSPWSLACSASATTKTRRIGPSGSHKLALIPWF